MIQYLLTLALLLCTCAAAAQELPNDLSDEEKIYAVSKVWKEVDKNFVFFDQVPDLDWDSVYQAFIPRVLATTSTYDHFKELQRMVSLLRDGHTRVVVPSQLRRELEARPPVVTERFGDRVVVTEIRNDTVRRQGLREGMVVTAIDGIAVDDYAADYVIPYMFYSTEQDLLVQAYHHHLLRGPRDTPVKLTTEGGRTFTVRRDLSMQNQRRPAYEFEVLDGNVGLLTLHRFQGDNLNEQFDSLYPALRQTDALLIDISVNRGGNSGFAAYVMSHFYDRPVETSRWKTIQYMPAYASYGDTLAWKDHGGWVVDPVEEGKRYLKPVALLISERTYSAGEDLASAFATSDRGSLIGRPTAGSTGNPIGFSLPGRGGLQVCTKRDYMADGREFVGYGIAPDVVVDKRIEQGELIEAGLRSLQK